jgi:hypothetical protein
MYLRREQVARDSYSRATFKRASLTASHPDIVGAWRAMDGHYPSVRVNMNESRANIAQPAQRVERDRAGVADHDQSVESGVYSRKAAEPPFIGDPIFDHEMATLDSHANPVPGERETTAPGFSYRFRV